MPKPNAQMQDILDAHKAMGPLPIESLTPELARLIPLPDRAAAAVYGQHFTKRAFAPMPTPVGKVKHQLIPGGEGKIMARIYTPEETAPEGGWPVLVYFHGGGWVIANLDTYDASCRALCKGAECIVVSVHYRQAPEHPWPAPVQDAIAAWQWVADNAASLKGNPSKLAIAGESAGGNLAAVVSLWAAGSTYPQPLHQLLVYPVTDLRDGMNSPSAVENAKAAPLNKAMLSWFYDLYVPAGADRADKLISPLHAKDVAGVPDATFILAQIDPLRSDGEAYARKLEDAGVNVDLKIFEGVTHEFFGLAGLVDEATEAMKMATDNLRSAFDIVSPSGVSVSENSEPVTPWNGNLETA